MLIMILKMSAVTALYVLLAIVLYKWAAGKKLSLFQKLVIGFVYGGASILSTHFGVDYSHMMLNVRDLGPLSAGLFFDPVSGIIAGFIGGIERFIVGEFFGIGSYTRIACSVSTCLAGIVAALMHIFIFKRKRPSMLYAFFMGAVMEVFHMYVVFITHRDDMSMAFYVVRICSPPMIIFSGLGLAASVVAISKLAGTWENPFVKKKKEEITITQKFQTRLFVVTAGILLLNLVFSFVMQTQTAFQNARDRLITTSGDIQKTYTMLLLIADEAESPITPEELAEVLGYFHVGSSGTIDLFNTDGSFIAGSHKDSQSLTEEEKKLLVSQKDELVFTAGLFGEDAMCRISKVGEELLLFTRLPMAEVYEERDSQMFELAFADIILFTVIYVLISMLVQNIVVNKIQRVNESLDRISMGHLDEKVLVRDSLEFASLSDDINVTVAVLKGYIDAEKKRMEEELELARTIQNSALPSNFVFPRHDFDLFASMDPAKEVGGDFYDYFFVDRDRLALVIADVSGKGVPASLFMMRAKTAIRGLAESGKTPAEILYRSNLALCEGNDAEMFVTVWLGIVDLVTGDVKCANAGHEYPMLMLSGGDFEVFKDRHGPPLAAIEGLRYREYELKMQPGDRLFVYTDGIPEAIDEKTEEYGMVRLARVLNENKQQEMSALLPAVREDIRKFVGAADQFDDITMLGFVYRPHG